MPKIRAVGKSGQPSEIATGRLVPEQSAGPHAGLANTEIMKNVDQTERDAKRLFPEDRWNKLHLQIIFYGREYSPARSPKRERDFITRTIGRKSEVAKLK